jgi:hypothetical protein
MPVSAHPTPLACKREPGVGIFILHTPTPNATLLARNRELRVGAFPNYETHVRAIAHVFHIFFFFFMHPQDAHMCVSGVSSVFNISFLSLHPWDMCMCVSVVYYINHLFTTMTTHLQQQLFLTNSHPFTPNLLIYTTHHPFRFSF